LNRYSFWENSAGLSFYTKEIEKRFYGGEKYLVYYLNIVITFGEDFIWQME